MSEQPGDRSKVITEALDRFKLAVEAEAAQRLREEDDLNFQIPSHTWPPEVQEARRGQTVNGLPLPARPMLSFPTLDQPVQLVLNQERAAKLGVEIHPISEDADDDTAEVLQGLYRRIEVDSRAGIARTWAFDRAVKAGRGVYRVLTEYADDEGGHPSDQRIVIKRVLYQGCVYLDPFAQEPDWSDGEWGFIVEDVPFDKYRRKFPKSQLASFDDGALTALGSEQPDWIKGDGASRTVRISEYFRKIYTTKRHEAEGDWAGREYEDCKVIWSTINAVEELDEPQPWSGRYIPFVPVIGRELQPVDGKRVWMGIIGPNKDAARAVNYAASGMVEAAALEPRAPFDVDPEEIEGYEAFWQQANVRNFPYLPRKKFLRGQITGPIGRIQADMSKVGMNGAILQMSMDQVQRGTGAYDDVLGRNQKEDSGRKVLALQQQHDQGSGDFLDSLAELSMTLEAKIILDLIPHVYDRPGRIARILGIEDKPSTVMLNQPFRMDPRLKKPVAVAAPAAAQGQWSPPPQMRRTAGIPGQPAPDADDVKHYDLRKGRYSVTVTVNKRFESRLQQGAEEIGQIMQAEPSLVPIIGPVYFKYRDGPGMREIGELLKKMRDQQFPFLKDEQDNQPDPQQELAKLQADNQQMKQMLDQAGKLIETKQIEQQGKLHVAQIQETAETQRNRENNETKLAVAELGAKVDRLTLFLEERSRIGVQGHEMAMGHADAMQDQAMAAQDHQRALEAAQMGQQHEVGMAAVNQQGALDQAQQAAQMAPSEAGA